ncbi:MAG TPA: GFA family protein [Rhizobiaceae bacterium]|nr:GFA family protein [Rhizobiaceae bacterium]
MSAATGDFTGGCACGDVRYRAQGPALFGLLCYCVDCQRASGATHVPIVGVARDRFEASGPIVQAISRGGSGMRAIRNRCANCGALLFGTPEAAPELVTIYAGSLDDPSLARLTKAQFVRHRPVWDTSGAGLASQEGAAP